jgi:hypothetical protein
MYINSIFNGYSPIRIYLVIVFLVVSLSEVVFKQSKSNDFLKFLKKIIIIKPIQNSKPAKANKKKEVDVKIRSSLIVPTIVV